MELRRFVTISQGIISKEGRKEGGVVMFGKKKNEPIRFGRTINKVPEAVETTVNPVSAPTQQQPVNVTINQNGRGDARVGRKSILTGAVGASSRAIGGLWRLVLDLVGLAFILLMIWVVAGLLQAAGVINLPFLDPLAKFFPGNFLKIFHFVVPAGTTTQPQ